MDARHKAGHDDGEILSMPAALDRSYDGIIIGAGLYLLSDLSTGVTGEVHFVDSGYNVIAMPQPDALRSDAAANKDAAQ